MLTKSLKKISNKLVSMSQAFLVNYLTRRMICHKTIRADDEAATCAFSRGCCEVNGTAVNAVWRTVPFKKI
jgi:hypothetical protein